MKNRLNFILLNGPMGSGKSTIKNLLRRDLIRTAILSIENVRSLISDFKPSSGDHELAWKIIHRMCDEYFKNGISVLLEQTVASEEIVNRFLRLAHKNKCNIVFYNLRTPKHVLLQRIKNRTKDRTATKSLIMSNIKKHEDIAYRRASVIDTSKVSAKEIAQQILKEIM